MRVLLAIMLPTLLLSCERPVDERPVSRLSGATMGTTFSIQLVAPPHGVSMTTLEDQVTKTLASIEASMSTYRPDSELSRFNAHSGSDWFVVSAELCAVVAAAQGLSHLTGGAFDITVGPLVNLWGFGPDITVAQPPGAERIAEAMRLTGNQHLQTDCSVPALAKALPALYVDLSAYTKGYAVDRIASLLSDFGASNYFVEIGGEIRVTGSNAHNQPWSIAIEAPHRGASSVTRVVELSDASMATSGDYRNYFEHDGRIYSHTIDPRSGYPVSHSVAAVSVVADSTALADGLATALLVLGPIEGMQFAEQQDIAALFQLRTDAGVQERMSTRFARELAKP
ncbi:MAG: FAD:protein FMN transferase [Gammaproteobacteria bacterium]|nr:FAD:protein FMN transferase [Gammaproteobacteria bacterium]